MMWTESNSISEIQSIIEDVFEKKMRLYVKICDIIDLSYDEYIVVTNKLRTIPFIDLSTHYGLCILVSWVASYKFNRQKQFQKVVMELIAGMPQHHTKFTLDALNNTCYDYQIYNYKIGFHNIESIQKIIQIHAGYDEFV